MSELRENVKEGTHPRVLSISTEIDHIPVTGRWLQEQQLIEVSRWVTINAGTSEKGAWSPPDAKASRDN